MILYLNDDEANWDADVSITQSNTDTANQMTEWGWHGKPRWARWKMT